VRDVVRLLAVTGIIVGSGCLERLALNLVHGVGLTQGLISAQDFALGLSTLSLFGAIAALREKPALKSLFSTPYFSPGQYLIHNWVAGLLMFGIGEYTAVTGVIEAAVSLVDLGKAALDAGSWMTDLNEPRISAT